MAQGVNDSDDFAKIGKELFSSAPEHSAQIQAEVTGKIPDWFEGTLLRVGPGKFEWGKSSYNHWFDGQALMHKFVVSKGKVEYSSAFLHSESFDKSKKYGRVATPGFATWAPPDPCKNIFQRFFLWFLPPAMTDNCNINFVEMKDEMFAVTETPYLYHVDTGSLETMEEQNIKTVLSGPRSQLAHPHGDADNNVYNVSSDMLKFKYEIFKVPAATNDEKPFSGTEVIARIPFSFTGPAYFHSFGMTENFFILIENPLVMKKLWKMFVMNFMKYSYFDVLKWKPELQSRMHLVDRKSGVVAKTYLVENFFAFHHVNAYEEAGNVIVDVCGYPDASVIKAFYLHNLRKGLKDVTYSNPSIRRYSLPIPNADSCSGDPAPLPMNSYNLEYELIYEGFELPRINYAYNGQKYKYTYGMAFRDANFFLEEIAKINVETKTAIRWGEEHCYPSEPVFIASPGAKDEDDGIVLSSVVGVLGKPSFLLFLDGKTFTEVARAVVPCKIALTFHGTFLE